MSTPARDDDEAEYDRRHLTRRACACALPHVPEAVRTLRHRVRAVLQGWCIPADTVDDALLVVSELATNAVRHALPPARLRVSLRCAGGSTVLRVEVSDRGPARHAPGEACSDDEHGRGLDIVRALAGAHGIRARPGHTLRWAELTIGSPWPARALPANGTACARGPRPAMPPRPVGNGSATRWAGIR